MSERQLALGFPAFDRDPVETLIEVDCQEPARRALAGWRHWPGGALLLIGPKGSGKSHLAAAWAVETGARNIDLAGGRAGRAQPEGGRPDALVIDDAEKELARRGREGELAMIALLDAVHAGSAGPLLLTARGRPAGWPIETPDLVSRLGLPPVVEIADADDDDLALVFEKHLADRGARPGPGVVDYVLRRAARSFAALEAVAAKLDTMALERKQRITRRLAQELLGDLCLDDGSDGHE